MPARSGRSQSCSRRQFLAGTTALAALASAGPVLLALEDKAASKAPIVGTDQHTYEVLADWAKLPAGRRFGYTHGICEDADGNILIHHQSPDGDSVCVFDPAGRFIRSWGSEYRQGAHGMQLTTEGKEQFLYFATTSQRFCCKTTLGGKVLWKLEYPSQATNAAGQPCYRDASGFNPTNIAIAPRGDFYIADGYGSNYIHHYNAKAEYLRTFGGSGSGPGQLSQPHGIWIDTRTPSPRVLVADRGNSRLQYFSMDGKPLSVVTGNLRRPCHFDQRGEELLIPDLDSRVSIVDRDNKVVVHLGENLDALKTPGYPNIPHALRRPGRFISPHQAIWDRAGNIYVVEWVSDGRVTKLRKV